MRHALGLLSLTAALSLAHPVRLAAQQVYYDQVRGYLERSKSAAALTALGYTHRDADASLGYFRVDPSLSPYIDTRVYLQAGFRYALVGKCDEDCSDMDLRLFDLDGDLVASDTEPDDTPVVTIAPRRSGNYTLRVTMPRGCSAPVGCYWLAQPFWKSL